MKANKHTLAFLFALSTLACHAQNLNESLTVEGKYTPEVFAADRLPVAPVMIPISAPESDLDYDLSGVTADFAPDALSMPATAWRASKAFDTSRGYLALRLGSWLDASLSAGYEAIRNDNTRLGIRLQHNSTSLWQAWKNELTPENAPTLDADHRFRYDETLGADLRHRIAGAGNISAQLQYHLGYFNYYGSTNEYGNQTVTADARKIKAPTQTLNDIYARVGWEGETGRPLTYHIDADLRYFGYRADYVFTGSGDVKMNKTPGNRETLMNAGGNVGYNFSESNKLGIGITYTGLFNHATPFGQQSINDVNRVRIVPAYDYSRGDISLRIGAELAIVSAGDTKFRVAPDVRFSMRKGLTAFTAAIGGGTHLRTLAWMHQMDYYSSPAYSCGQAAYSPIDARLALQFNPGGKWTFGVEGLWRTTLDETLGGLYQSYINREFLTDSPIPLQTRIAGFSLGVNAGYDFCRYFALRGKANWQPQHGKRGMLNGFDRPAVTAALSALSHPTDALSISLEYDLRAKRQLLKGNISRLNLTADYMITDRFSVGAEIRNLLNRHEMLLPSLPSEGLTVNAGLQITF